MILSFHPCFEGDQNRLCAGRMPDRQDRAAIQSANAVILPQCCPEPLYRMACSHCRRVFPNYDARFAYPGKTGQIRLFRTLGIPHPRTTIFANARPLQRLSALQKFRFPLIFKFDWGGDGDMVYFLKDVEALSLRVRHAAEFERSGQSGFLLQEYVPSRNRSLRVVVMGGRLFSYWRIQPDPADFRANIAQGADMDTDADPQGQAAGRRWVRSLCRAAGINLAGIDLIFRAGEGFQAPYFLEINYFFGRRIFGGLSGYYDHLTSSIRDWLCRFDDGLSPARTE